MDMAIRMATRLEATVHIATTNHKATPGKSPNKIASPCIVDVLRVDRPVENFCSLKHQMTSTHQHIVRASRTRCLSYPLAFSLCRITIAFTLYLGRSVNWNCMGIPEFTMGQPYLGFFSRPFLISRDRRDRLYELSKFMDARYTTLG